MGEAVLDESACDRPELRPGARWLRCNGFELTASVPEPRDVGERGDAERPPVVPVRGDESIEEVDLVLVAYPLLVEILERIEKARGCELGGPDRVEHGKVGRLTLGDRMRQRLVECGSGHGDDVHLDLRGRAFPDHPRPRPFLRNHDPDLRLVGTSSQPVRVDERAATPMAQDHPFLGELRERAAHRRAADPVAVTQLVLGRQLAVPSVELPRISSRSTVFSWK